MKTLFITDDVPWAPKFGGAQRTLLLLRALNELGKVDCLHVAKIGGQPLSSERLEEAKDLFGFVDSLCPHSDSVGGKALRAIRALSGDRGEYVARLLGFWPLSYQTDAHTARRFQQIASAGNYDLVVGRYISPTARAGAFGSLPLILDVDDWDPQILETKFRDQEEMLFKRFLYGFSLDGIKKRVNELIGQANHAWFCTDEDCEVAGFGNRSSVLHNIPYLKPGSALPSPTDFGESSETIVFIGALWWAPNLKGIDDFVKNVWPTIRSRCPSSRLQIVGEGAPESVAAIWRKIDGVDVIGFHPDLSVVYKQCAFTIVPLTSGGGSKIKLIESFAHGRTAVLSKYSYRGFGSDFKQGEELLVAESRNEMANHCVSLLSNPLLRRSMAERAQKIALDRYSFVEFSRTVQRTVESILRKT